MKPPHCTIFHFFAITDFSTSTRGFSGAPAPSQIQKRQTTLVMENYQQPKDEQHMWNRLFISRLNHVFTLTRQDLTTDCCNTAMHFIYVFITDSYAINILNLPATSFEKIV
jgi:hypothetical protein